MLRIVKLTISHFEKLFILIISIFLVINELSLNNENTLYSKKMFKPAFNIQFPVAELVNLAYLG